ncbi:hypothetical protein JCM8547_006420 [Rhodosporidiobolus lusitaniae]
MPVPPLPNELITLIFEHLYDEISTDRISAELIKPIYLHYFFLPLLQNRGKSVRALAMPFFLRYADAETQTHIVHLSKKYGISHPLRSLAINPSGPSFEPSLSSEHAYCQFGKEFEWRRSRWRPLWENTNRLVFLDINSSYLFLEVCEVAAFPSLHAMHLSVDDGFSLDKVLGILDAPRLVNLNLVLPRHSTTLPVILPSVQFLALENLAVHILPALLALCTASPSSLTRLTINTHGFDIVERLIVLLQEILDAAASNGIDLRNDFYTRFQPAHEFEVEPYEPEAERDADEIREERRERRHESKETWEDYKNELDWDAEEDPVFREHWSEQRWLEHEIDQVISASKRLQQYPTSEVALAAAKGATEAAEQGRAERAQRAEQEQKE